ncbi:tRNA (cytosine(72)-C(5))-methyltransferase NSUN6 [Plutella xylostella]|uniref:tRNA (cytosine(72)-C(5))-methyltransferase NSUN6 n=1 Tax=Plutella xylostella TaxID=51655 RepID=UPI0020322D38|nr:tRNA (cytosine(72)-C(5))-methyltransferase NSUN6 [Plutella xylostella]
MAQILKHSEILREIRRNENIEEVHGDIINLMDWLAKAPKYTIFRINKLRKFDPEIIEVTLKLQCEDLEFSRIPKFYLLKPDCLVLERWPDDENMTIPETEVIVDASCAAAVLRGAHVFAPGVMGLPTNCQLDSFVSIYGDLEEKCKKGLKVQYNGRKIFVGMGQLKMLRNQLYGEDLEPSGIAVHTIMPASRLPVINETMYPKGDILLQNLPSIVCGWVVDSQPGEAILDMCAAPGNKTTHIAEMSNDKAMITAIDKTVKKVEKIQANAMAHGIKCIKCYAYDSTKCWSDASTGINVGPPFPSNSFDKVLLDAPCSGLGQRPLLLNKMTPKMLNSYKFVQRKLMKSAVAVLKVGGKLIYSTCTITEDENEGMVAWALQEFQCLRLVAAEPLLGGPGWSGCGLTDEQRVLVQRFGPEMDPLRPVDDLYRDTIGFFIACFTKIEN